MRVRKVLPALTLGLLCASAIVAATACSGDDSGATLFQDSGAGDGSGDDTTTSGGDDVSSGSDGSGGGDASQTDGPPIVFLDGGPDVGPVPCVAGGVLETEPNDNLGQANTINGNVPMCGQITRAQDGGLDEDYFAFHMQASTTTMTIEFNGNVSLTVSVDGGDGGRQEVVLSPTSTSTPVPFVKDKQYTIVVRSFDGNPQNYRVTIHES